MHFVYALRDQGLVAFVFVLARMVAYERREVGYLLGDSEAEARSILRHRFGNRHCCLIWIYL